MTAVVAFDLDGILSRGTSVSMYLADAMGYGASLRNLEHRYAAGAISNRDVAETASGTAMEVTTGLLTGQVARHFSEFDNCDFVPRWCEERATSLDEVVAVGDSRSDLPLFSVVGRSVALNATPDARAAADEALDTEDLRDVLPFVRGDPW